MEKIRSQMTDRMLNLTLEIIYLLTGENYVAFKLSDGLVATNLKTQNIIIETSNNSLGKNNKQILEVTSEMIELLTGAVLIRRQDVTVCSSMEEEQIEGHKDLYKDAIIENHPHLPSPDRASNLMENTPEKCPDDLSSHVSNEENCKIQQYHQEENSLDVELRVKEEAEDTYIWGEEPFKEEETPPDLSPDWQHGRNNLNRLPLISPNDDIKLDSPEGDLIDPELHLGPLSADPSSGPSTHGGRFPDCSPPVTHHTAHRGGNTFPCSECGKCFAHRAALLSHQTLHKGKNSYSCFECGKCFVYKASFVIHQRSHTGEKPYFCSECGKYFSQRSNLTSHQRTHTGEKPYPCSECGKCFARRLNLAEHQRIHSGEKPFSCSECGKRFSKRGSLKAHQVIHTGQQPYSCSECGKDFGRKKELVEHERTHLREKPFMFRMWEMF